MEEPSLGQISGGFVIIINPLETSGVPSRVRLLKTGGWRMSGGGVKELLKPVLFGGQ